MTKPATATSAPALIDSNPDPKWLFNSSLEGNTRRAIDRHEGDTIDEKALKGLIPAAVALNTAPKTERRSRAM